MAYQNMLKQREEEARRRFNEERMMQKQNL